MSTRQISACQSGPYDMTSQVDQPPLWSAEKEAEEKKRKREREIKREEEREEERKRKRERERERKAPVGIHYVNRTVVFHEKAVHLFVKAPKDGHF